ncbi:MAG: hypothetical protein AAGI07_18345, partial [Bacteroidota bacterium]
NAQSHFKPGYVVKEVGDTLFGFIDYRGDILMRKVCVFREREGSIKQEFYPNEIHSYRFIDSKYFISKEIKGKQVFLEFLVNGEVDVYYSRDEEGEYYYLGKKDVPVTEIVYEEGIKYEGDKVYNKKSTKHMGQLLTFMQDAPNFRSRIYKVEKPEHRPLIKLAEDYHNVVCKGEECIVYGKKLSGLKFNIEILGGILQWSNNEIGNNYFQKGVIAHIWMPRSNEKIFFRTGILHTQLQTSSTTTNYYKIPLHIEYIYPKGFLRPKASFGVNVYEPITHSLALMGGFNIRLGKSLFYTVNYDIDFEPNEFLIFPKKMFSHSVLTGFNFVW